MNFPISLDERTRFPLISIPQLNLKVQWLPVTKIQIEYFLSSINDSAYDAQWYEQIMYDNPRVSPVSLRRSNYWGAIATNVLPRDCLRFASWMGRGYRLMEGQEWLQIYRLVHGMSSSQEFVDRILETEGLDERTRQLIMSMEKAAQQAYNRPQQERTLAHQMLMLMGVIEYVYTNDSHNQYGGLGSTNTEFFPSMATPESGIQNLANAFEGARMKHYGFRLVQET